MAKQPQVPDKRAPKQDDPERVMRFIETAEAVEADHGPGAFEKGLKKVVPQKPNHQSKSGSAG